MIEETVVKLMKPYYALIPSNEGKLLAQLKSDTILRELRYDEQTGMYECHGYILANHALNGQLKPYQK
jgi:GTPase